MDDDRLSIFYKGKHSYDIVYREDFTDLYCELLNLKCSGRKICIVTDSNVKPLYSDKVFEVIKDLASKVVVFTFMAGEDSKNLSTVQHLYEFLIKNNFDRNDLLIALGGGVVGDLTGFAAATYLRGIRFVQIPTSLLAMADSSIGGKTGVDFNAYKNMIGAFYMPILVYMNINTLHSLKDREYYSGFAEIIKHGYIKDKEFLDWLKASGKQLNNRNNDVLKLMAIRSCKVKKEVVEQDPKEQGERALLNFGHTLGHSIEKLMNFKLLHGECVAIGMVAAGYISYIRGDITNECLTEMKSILNDFHLPVLINSLSTEDIVSTVMYDKKKDGNKIKFILLSSVGNAVIDTTVTAEEMREASEYILL